MNLLEDGVGWRVGSGQDISIWMDRWFPKWAGGKIQHSIITDSVTKFFELISLNPKQWNEEVNSSVFAVENATAIRCVPLSDVVVEDRLIWIGDRTGEYTVRSGYRYLLEPQITNSSNSNTKEIYKKLWQQKIPTKIKNYCLADP